MTQPPDLPPDAQPIVTPCPRCATPMTAWVQLTTDAAGVQVRVVRADIACACAALVD